MFNVMSMIRFLMMKLNILSFLYHAVGIPCSLYRLKFCCFVLSMEGMQQFCLRWNDFQNHMVSSFRLLRDEKSFTDVTLACDGQTCTAHKMVLSACSPYFKTLLEQNPAKHPIIILKDVAFPHLQAILEFMYTGEVNVAQEQLPTFLKVAERLKVRGLAEVPQTVKQS